MTRTRLFEITLYTLLLAMWSHPPALAQMDCPKDWADRGMSQCDGKCYAGGTMSRYDNPCFARESRQSPPSPASCWGEGMKQPKCAPWRTPPPPPPPPPDAATANLMSRLLGGANVPSAQVEAVVNALRGNMMVGSTGASAAGRAAASMIGVGNCTRHFYNKSDDYWSVALLDAGWCHIDGAPQRGNGNVCIIPPRENGLLEYSNSGSSTNPQILIAGTWPGGQFAQGFYLEVVGCKIAHDGSSGNVVLNDPGKGDVITCGRYSYPCR